MPHRRLVVGLAVALAALAACGTRLPDSAFTGQQHPSEPPPTSTGPTSTPATGNTASDTGVTPTTITIGQIASVTNPFDPQSFVGPTLGLQAFVRYTNAHGGVHGRQL